MLLSRRLERRQWASLGVLAMGVAVVQLASAPARPTVDPAVPKAIASRMIHRLPQLVTKDPIVGIAAVVIQAISSGFASVFFERQLKQRTATTSIGGNSVWIKNIQLSIFGVVFAGLAWLVELNGPVVVRWLGATMVDGPADAEGVAVTAASTLRLGTGEFFGGFSPLVWSIVGLQVFGGLLVALVMKYADNIGPLVALRATTDLRSQELCSRSRAAHLGRRQRRVLGLPDHAGRPDRLRPRHRRDVRLQLIASVRSIPASHRCRTAKVGRARAGKARAARLTIILSA